MNFIGNNELTRESSEFVQMLRGADYEIGDICLCRTYEDYQKLGESQLNITYNPAAVAAAKELERRLGIPHLHLPLSYDYEEIDGNLKKLSQYLKMELPNLDILRQKAEEELAETAKELKG